MTHDEYQRERMRLWARMYVSNFVDGNPPGRCSDFADDAVVEFDKRFPAPVEPVAEVAPQTPAEDYVNRSYSRGYHDGAQSVMQGMPTIAELTTLREKARLWDAVADGAINLSYYESAGFQASWPAPAANGGTARCGSGSKHTAAEAVEAAIDAGALK